MSKEESDHSPLRNSVDALVSEEFLAEVRAATADMRTAPEEEGRTKYAEYRRYYELLKIRYDVINRGFAESRASLLRPLSYARRGKGASGE